MTEENTIYNDTDIRLGLLRMELDKLKKLKIEEQLSNLYNAKNTVGYFLNNYKIKKEDLFSLN